MAKKPSNQGKPWTSKDVSELDTLAKQNMPTRLTQDGADPRAKVKQKGISLKSTGPRPYGTEKW
jgi:hypothetical protein